MAIYRVQVKCTFAAGSGGGTNTWHLRTPSTGFDLGDQSSVSGLMDIVEAFYDAVDPLFPGTYVWTWDGTATQVNTESPGMLASGTAWTVTGTSGGGYTAAAGMACVSWKTELAARRGRGRTFLGPLASAQVEANGTLQTAAIGVIDGAASALVASSTAFTGGGAVGVFSQNSEVEGPTLRDITGYSITDQVAVLRSRRS